MGRWGIVLTLVYAVIAVGVLLPWGLYLSGMAGNSGISGFLEELGRFYSEWLVWVLTSIVIVGQSILLFLSVDSSQKRLKPQTHIWISCAAASALTGLLA